MISCDLVVGPPHKLFTVTEIVPETNVVAKCTWIELELIDPPTSVAPVGNDQLYEDALVAATE